MIQPDHPRQAGNPVDPSSREGATSVTLGDILRQARERQALTLDEVARRTRIPRRHLEALEQNSLAGLPPGMYQRAEVRAYADAVGLDPQLALSALGRAQVASPLAADARPPQPPQPPRLVSAPAPAPRTRRRVRPALIMVVVLALPVAVASVLWWRDTSGPVGVRPPAVEDKTVPASLRPGPAADPRIDVATDAAALTPSPGGSESSPKVFEYPELRVITEPPGARVTVDGVGWGQSPMTIRTLPPGSRLVRVTLDGYSAQERHVAVPGDTSRTTVRITLRRLR